MASETDEALRHQAHELLMALHMQLIPLWLHAIELEKRDPKTASEIRPQQGMQLQHCLMAACWQVYRPAISLLILAKDDDLAKAALKAFVHPEEDMKGAHDVTAHRMLTNVERAMTALGSPIPIIVLRAGLRLPGDA